MKKYINPSPIPNGGLPIFGSDMMDCLQSEVYKAIVAQYKAYNEPVIVYGGVATDGGATVSITAGMVFLDNELMEMPAYNGVYPVYLKQAEPVIISKLYKDQSPRPVTVQRIAEWSTNAPGTGEYIAYDPYTSQQLKDVRRRFDTPLMKCEWYPAIPNADAFDISGAGKWEWKGFHFANGNDGTTDARSRVLAMYDSRDYQFYLGANLGAKTHTLSVAEMPAHTHGYNRPDNPGSHPGGSNGYDRPNGVMSSTTSSAGSGNAHNNMQPTLFGVWIQRKD